MTAFINTKNWPWIAFVLSGGLLLGALGFEHIGGMAPCQMCYWQRHAHKAVLVISGIALISRYASKSPRWDRAFTVLIGLAFLISLGLAFWHVGVEYKWWIGPKTCSAIQSDTPINSSDILKILEGKTKMPDCSDAPWHLFKVSMAGYNAMISALGALLSFTARKI